MESTNALVEQEEDKGLDLTRVVGQFVRLWGQRGDTTTIAAAKRGELETAVKVEEQEGEGDDTVARQVVDGAGIGLGTVVFAPYRRKCSASLSAVAATAVECHYALAEVTGVQSSAGTVTVAFLFADPGVDDEAVSLFDLVPCPPGWVERLLLPLSVRGAAAAAATMKPVSPACSLLERVMGWPVHKGPLNASQALAELKKRDNLSLLYCLGHCHTKQRQELHQQSSTHDEGTAAGVPPPPPTTTASASASVPLSLSSSSASMCFSFERGAGNIHAFFASTFQHVDMSIERRAAVATARGRPPTLLCVFDRYDVLRRFEVYMTVRGHVVRLLDGEEGKEDEDGEAAAPLRPAAREAFGSMGKVWLCMLRDDALDERALDGLLGNAVAANAVDHLVTFHSSSHADDEQEGEVARRNVLAYLAATGAGEEDGRDEHDFLLSVKYSNIPPEEEETTTTTAPPKVSGTVFGERKLFVPASREQLLLLQTVRQSTVVATAGRCKGEKAVAAVLSPALLERIALGNFTDSAVANLFASYKHAVGILSPISAAATPTPNGVDSGGGGGCPPCHHRKRPREERETDQHQQPHQQPQGSVFARMSDLRHKLCRDGSRFGEAFPVFAAVTAIVHDAIAGDAADASSSFQLPRVAVVFPRGNPTGNPLLVTHQFTNALRQLFAPLAVYELRDGRDGDGSLPPSVLWWRHGGLLVLHCDEASARFSALHESASVVVACGRSAAAWVAANATAARCFAVLSEVEAVPPHQHDEHLWVPFAMPPDARSDTEDELWLPPELDKSVPAVLQHAVALHTHLARHRRGADRELTAFVRRMAHSIAHATPLRLCDLLVAHQ